MSETKIEWSERNGVPISLERRNRMAQEAVNKGDVRSLSTGDTMIVVSRDEDGTVRVYDTMVRRSGVVSRAPSRPSDVLGDTGEPSDG